MLIDFEVSGVPQPQGSTRAFVTKSGKAVTTSANKALKPWRQDFAMMAQIAMREAGAEVTNEAVHLKLMFYFQRPKSLKRSVVHKTTRPDCDKLARSVFDSLTGICYRDDSQVVSLEAYKRFGERAYTRVIVEEAK